MRLWALLFFFCLTGLPLAAEPTAAEILRRLDQNQLYPTLFIESTMIIQGRKGQRRLRSQSWSQGREKSFIRYLSPPRERGTSMLKLKDQLWLYSPQADRTIAIAGHMLRQPIMGSDLSYEDMMERTSLVKNYQATKLDNEVIQGAGSWVLELKAKQAGLAYPKQRIWVDPKKIAATKVELYGSRGKLLKRVTIQSFIQTPTGWYPSDLTYKDMLK